MSGTLARIGRLIPGLRARSGSNQPPATISGRVSWPEPWFQFGWSPLPRNTSALAFPAVFASIDTISSDIARLPIKHYRIESRSPRNYVEVENSAALRVLNQPNDYQSQFDLIKLLIASQLFRGNGYLLGWPNGRNEFDELHPLSPNLTTILRAGREVFYQVSAQPLSGLPQISILPARVILNHRVTCLHDPLYGDTPITAAAISTGTGLSILHSTHSFFRRMSRPSGVLQTAGRLDRDRAEEIKERWVRVYRGEEQAGDVVVLEEGLQWQQLTMSAVDAQLIDQLRYSVEDVARVFRLPLFMLGDLSKASFSSSEQLMRAYYQGCLAGHITALERGLTKFFGMNPREEYLQCDLDELFRSDMRARIESLVRSIMGGLRTPNEARAIEGLNPVEGGDLIFLQQQMIPARLLANRTDIVAPPQRGTASLPTLDVSRDVIDQLFAQMGLPRDDDGAA